MGRDSGGPVGGMTAEIGVWPGQRVAVQKMSPRGGNNFKCQGKSRSYSPGL